MPCECVRTLANGVAMPNAKVAIVDLGGTSRAPFIRQGRRHATRHSPTTPPTDAESQSNNCLKLPVLCWLPALPLTFKQIAPQTATVFTCALLGSSPVQWC